MRLEFGVHVIPHPDKVAKGGEDAHFIADDLKWFGGHSFIHSFIHSSIHSLTRHDSLLGRWYVQF